jgi:hypothetical protein
VTNETFRWLTDARFHPSGERLVATKWYTGERSLGSGEGWAYDVPSLDGATQSVPVGAGTRLVGRPLPPDWSADMYNEQQIGARPRDARNTRCMLTCAGTGAEQYIWAGNDTLIYAKNVIDDGVFTYSKGSSASALDNRALTMRQTSTRASTRCLRRT